MADLTVRRGHGQTSTAPTQVKLSKTARLSQNGRQHSGNGKIAVLIIEPRVKSNGQKGLRRRVEWRESTQ